MKTLSEDNIDLLTNNILAQARHFLDDAGEFFPFGTVIDKYSEIKPVGFYLEDDIPDSLYAFNQLQSSIKAGIDQDAYLAAAIAMEIYINATSGAEIKKLPGIQITYYSKKDEITRYYLTRNRSASYSFEEYML